MVHGGCTIECDDWAEGIQHTNCPGYRICCVTTGISSIVCKDVIACLCRIHSTTFTDSNASFVGISGRCPRIGVGRGSHQNILYGISLQGDDRRCGIFDNHRSGCCHTIVRVGKVVGA